MKEESKPRHESRKQVRGPANRETTEFYRRRRGVRGWTPVFLHLSFHVPRHSRKVCQGALTAAGGFCRMPSPPRWARSWQCFGVPVGCLTQGDYPDWRCPWFAGSDRWAGRGLRQTPARIMIANSANNKSVRKPQLTRRFAYHPQHILTDLAVWVCSGRYRNEIPRANLPIAWAASTTIGPGNRDHGKASTIRLAKGAMLPGKIRQCFLFLCRLHCGGTETVRSRPEARLSRMKLSSGQNNAKGNEKHRVVLFQPCAANEGSKC